MLVISYKGGSERQEQWKEMMMVAYKEESREWEQSSASNLHHTVTIL